MITKMQSTYPLLMIGILSYALFVGGIVIVGKILHVPTSTSYYHNPDHTRFHPKPLDLKVASNFYYWQLKHESRTFSTRYSVWLLYTLHIACIWCIQYYATQQEKRGNTRSRLGKWNYISLLGNFLFHVIRVLHTHWWYDGLAQITPIASSQSSVILLLVFILMMEYRDRGILFGWPSPNNSFLGSDLIRKYHGYAFSWAAIYTMWYHPVEGTWGHALGFFHTSMILLQGSFLFTNAHLNKLWIMFLESFVIIHAGVVGYQTGATISGTFTRVWPMFVFGFLFVFTSNQIFAFREFWARMPNWTRIIPFSLYSLASIYCYYRYIPNANGRYFVRIHEILRIPIAEFVFAVMLVLFTIVTVKIRRAIGVTKVTSRAARIILVSLCFAVHCCTIGYCVWMHYYAEKKRGIFIHSIRLVLVFGTSWILIFQLLDIASGNSKMQRERTR